jgi:carbon-monoxide dehydrogenase small subunit
MSAATENGRVVAGNETVELTVNGARRSGRAEPRLLLADFLRHELGLTGTHLGCEHGVCGACTVLIDGEPLRSCLMFAVQAQGADVTTIEGLASPVGELHPVQQAFHAKHGLQCGFCTPGMVLTTVALLEDNPAPSEPEIREYMSGNICRCTGYVGIVDSIQEAAATSGGSTDGH